MSNVPLPEPDISVPFLSEVRKVPQGDYYRADKVLPLLKQWAVLYEAAKAGHEQAFAEAQNAAAVSAADNAALRERVKVLEDALLRVARMAEALKKDCGMDPESPQAVRNGQYMNISYSARAALAARKGTTPTTPPPSPSPRS